MKEITEEEKLKLTPKKQFKILPLRMDDLEVGKHLFVSQEDWIAFKYKSPIKMVVYQIMRTKLNPNKFSIESFVEGTVITRTL